MVICDYVAIRAYYYSCASSLLSKIKKERLNVNDLFNAKGGKYFYGSGFNSKAMYAWAISGYIAVGTVWPNLLIFDALKDFFANAGGGFAWIIGAALGAVIHLAISKKR